MRRFLVQLAGSFGRPRGLQIPEISHARTRRSDQV